MNYLNNFKYFIFFSFLFFKFPFFFFKIINKYFLNFIKSIFFLFVNPSFFYFFYLLFLYFFYMKKNNFIYFLINFYRNYYLYFYFFICNYNNTKMCYLINEINNNFMFYNNFFFSNYLINSFSNFIFNIYFCFNFTIETHIMLFNKLITFFFLDHNVQMKQFIDLVGIDYPNKKNRFFLLYQFNSFLFNFRYFFKFNTNEFDWIPSLSYLFFNIIWYEREVFDLFGIHFSNNNDLRRILTDYGFKGFPLRKDFPLVGFVEVSFNEEIQKLSFLPIQLIQSYKIFDTFCPWTLFYNKVCLNKN